MSETKKGNRVRSGAALLALFCLALSGSMLLPGCGQGKEKQIESAPEILKNKEDSSGEARTAYQTDTVKRGTFKIGRASCRERVLSHV